jgi:hypothetical protein
VTSAEWNAKHKTGTHTLEVSIDPRDAVYENDESNNVATRTFVVQGNKLENGSFEASSSGTAPDGWSSSGATGYGGGGSDGDRAVTATLGGSWTSAPVNVEAGKSYGFSVAAFGASGTVLVEQLSATGAVVGTLTQTLALAGAGFDIVTGSFTAPPGAAAIRVVLVGAVAGVTTFDDARLWQE